jgi:acyl-CoA synthetase (NDP forming)
VTGLHTGSKPVTPEDWAWILESTGAIGVDSMEGLIDTAATLSLLPRFSGPRLGLLVLTGGQGPAITDIFARRGLRVPALSAASLAELATFFDPIGGSYRNPLDAAYAIHEPAMLGRELAILDRDPNIDFVAMDLFQNMMSALRLKTGARNPGSGAPAAGGYLETIVAHAKSAKKPFFVIVSSAETERESLEIREILLERGVPTFASAERAAVACEKALAHWARRPA